jgi:hypothetical protein
MGDYLLRAVISELPKYRITSTVMYGCELIVTKNGLGYIMGDFFPRKASGHSAASKLEPQSNGNYV